MCINYEKSLISFYITKTSGQYFNFLNEAVLIEVSSTTVLILKSQTISIKKKYFKYFVGFEISKRYQRAVMKTVNLLNIFNNWLFRKNIVKNKFSSSEYVKFEGFFFKGFAAYNRHSFSVTSWQPAYAGGEHR